MCFALLWLADRCRATVPASPLLAKNSPQGCFLDAQTLSGSSPNFIAKTKNGHHTASVLFLAGAEGLAACFALLWLADRCRATVPGSPLLAKNSPQDCFLNAQTLPGSSPNFIAKTKNGHHTASVLFLAGAEGLEPSARGFGDHCSTN